MGLGRGTSRGFVGCHSNFASYRQNEMHHFNRSLKRMGRREEGRRRGGGEEEGRSKGRRRGIISCPVPGIL